MGTDHDEQQFRLFRVESLQMLNDLQGGCLIAGLKIRYAEIEPDVGTVRIDSQSLPIGVNRVFGTVEFVIRVPKVVPGIKIVRIDFYRLPVGADRIVVAFKFAIRHAELELGSSTSGLTFRPIPTPIDQPFPILRFCKQGGMFQPFNLNVPGPGLFLPSMIGLQGMNVLGKAQQEQYHDYQLHP